MSNAPTYTLEDYTRSSWRRGFSLYLEHPFIHAGRWFRYASRRLWPGRALRFTDGDGNRYVSMKNNFTSFAVAVLGQRDPEVMTFLRGWIRPGFVVCDIGANVGTYTVPLARLVGPSGRVVAFEPNRTTCACLSQNVRQNRLGNVRIVRAAAGDRASHARLIVTPDNLGETHLASPDDGSARGERVEVTTLDAEVSKLRLPRVDFIKIDVEGFELTALRGAVQTLRANPRLVVQTEIVPTHASRYGYGVDELVAFFATHGYSPYTCDSRGAMRPADVSQPPLVADWFWACSEDSLRSGTAAER